MGPLIVVLFWAITRYEKRGPWMAGFHEAGLASPECGWFLFDCRSGAVSGFRDEPLWNHACANSGFTPPVVMKSVRENWDSYWHDPNRRKN